MEQFKKLFQATDMTVGTPWKKIVAFTIPMLLGNIAQQLYNTVDSIVVGKYVGDNALAGDVDCFIRQQRGNVGIGTDAVPVGEFFRRVIVDVGYAQKIGVAGQLKQSVGVKIRNYAAADDAESQLFSVVCHKNIS